MTSSVEAAPVDQASSDTLAERIRANISGGNLGSWPVAIGLVLIVLFFSFKADNFFTAPNFTNIITQMAGVTMLAYGVVFVLLIGEIDLSISYVAGVGGVVVAQMTLVASSQEVPGWLAIMIAVGACALIGAFQGSIVALVGVPAFVVTLAGYQIWQGVIQKSIPQGVIVIQNNTVNNVANYFFSERAGWIMAFVIAGLYLAATIGGIVLAARLNSVDLNAGGGTLLIDAIAAAVIGGCSLFGGRGEVRDALFGSLVIATIANGLNTLNLTQGVIYIITGCILLFAVTLDTILRSRQKKAGR